MKTDAAVSNNLTRDEARERAGLVTVASYDVELDLRTPEPAHGETFRSTTVLRFACARPGEGSFVEIAAPSLRSATLNGEPVELGGFDGERLTLPALAADNELVVDADCRYMRTGEGLHRFVDPVDSAVYLYTQFETYDAHRVFACFDQPDLKATFALTVHAPAGWTCVSGGAVVEQPAVGDAGRWCFATMPQVSTYITALVAGPYAAVHDEHDGIPLGLYCRASLAEHLDAGELFTITKQGFDFYHRVFGYRYPFGKYDQLFVPEFNAGAMENAGCVTFLEDYVFRSKVTDAAYERRAETVLHEMAHMWFGDLVTMRWWDDLWLNESFATYMSVLAQASDTRWTNAWTTFANAEKTWAYRQDQLPSTHPIAADIRDMDDVRVNFDGITYAKGASVLKQLVAFVGRKPFLSATRQYFRKHEYGNTTLADLLDVLATATGQDLAAWSCAWLQTSGVPSLRAEVVVEDGAFTDVAIVQDAVDPVTGLDEPRPHRVRVGLYSFDAGGMLERTQVEAVTVEGARTAVPALAGVTQPDLLLINDDDLTYAKLSFDERSLATLLTSIHRVQDPLARATCLTALWSSTRDARLAVRSYLDTVVLAAPAETGVGVLQVLLVNVHAAIEGFAPADQRPELRHRVSDVLWDGLRAAEAGSDLQLAWARALAVSARTSTRAADVVRAVLDGEERVSGLPLDQELRWLFLQGLAAQQRLLPGELEAERAADATASGRVGFTLASAAIPDATIKKATWDEAVHGDRLSNELLSAAIEGFMLGSRDLLHAYEEPYFGVIRDVWATRGIEMASRIVRGLYPVHQDVGAAPNEHPVVTRTDDWLQANADAPAALRRIVIEERDHLLRSLKAQAKGQG